MTRDQFGRLDGDRASTPKGFTMPGRKGMLLFNLLLALAAIGSGVVSLQANDAWLQVVPFTLFVVSCLCGLYLSSRRSPGLNPEIKLQVVLSITTYFTVVGAACGYALAISCGPDIGPLRTVALYAASLTFVLPFSFILILNALQNRERQYCLGLATALLLTGMITWSMDPHYCFPLAHGLMAVGALMSLAIQWVQVRDAECCPVAS